jgi:prepilin-type N-terminal cleavage/methylation domain-containing protein
MQRFFYSRVINYFQSLLPQPVFRKNLRVGVASAGFTIVELLIVVVVIGVLAAIVIVAYNGVTTRTKNEKTVTSVNDWVKALRYYEADTGSLPTTNSCLGTTTTYSGNGQCWNNASWVVYPAFLNLLSPYIKNYPEPDISEIDSTANPSRRGALYIGSVTPRQIYVMQIGVTSCPSIGGATYSTSGTGADGRYCVYTLQ